MAGYKVEAEFAGKRSDDQYSFSHGEGVPQAAARPSAKGEINKLMPVLLDLVLLLLLALTLSFASFVP